MIDLKFYKEGRDGILRVASTMSVNVETRVTVYVYRVQQCVALQRQQHRTLNCSVREPVHPASSLSLQDFLLSSFARRSLMGNIYFEGLNHLGAGVQPFSCRINSTKDQYSNSNVGLFNCILGTMNVHQLQDQSIQIGPFPSRKIISQKWRIIEKIINRFYYKIISKLLESLRNSYIQYSIYLIFHNISFPFLYLIHVFQGNHIE